jgi:hypothetical protein
MKLSKVIKEGFVFESKGGECLAPFQKALPYKDGYDFSWDGKTRTLTYYVGDDRIEKKVVFSEAEIKEAADSLFVESFDAQEAVERLWNTFNFHAEQHTDVNSRISIAMLLSDPSATEVQRQRAGEWGLWWEYLWKYYAMLKHEILTKRVYPSFDLSKNTPPWSIWEIASK